MRVVLGLMLTAAIAIAQFGGGGGGKAGMAWKGAWTAVTQYAVNDTVRHDGAAWVARAASVNSEPTQANADWAQIVAPESDVPYASLPAPGVAGRVLFSTDSWLLAQDSGTAWAFFGPAYKLTPPPALNTWTLINQGASAISEGYGGIHMMPANVGAANSTRLLVRAQPAPPYTLTATIAFLGLYSAAAGTRSSCGIGWRESSTGKLTLIEAAEGTSAGKPQVLVQTWPNANSAPAASVFQQATAWAGGAYPKRFRIEHTGALLRTYLAIDGTNWMQLSSQALNAYFTAAPDQLAFAGTIWDATGKAACTLLSWEVTTP